MKFVDLGDGWAIGVYDHNNYVVGKTAVTVDSKTGRDRETIAHPSYFQLMSDALNYAARAMAKEKHKAHRSPSLERWYNDYLAVEARIRELTDPIRKTEERMAREASRK